jgi:hypothetical protein
MRARCSITQRLFSEMLSSEQISLLPLPVLLPEMEHRGDSSWELAGTITVSLPEQFIVQALPGVLPFPRAQFVNPPALGGAFGRETVTFLVGIKPHVRERSLAAGFAEMITDLVFRNAHQPACFCGSACEGLPTF